MSAILRRFSTVLALTLVCCTVVLMTGCNTVKGAGTDIYKAGDETSKAIDKAVD